MKNKGIIFSVVLVILSFLIGFYFYPQMPDQVASHWNGAGEVDGYMSKFWGVFLMPMILLGMLLIYYFVPKIDPLKKNIKQFMKYYEMTILAIVGFLFYIYLLTFFWNMGYIFNMTFMLMPAMAVLFYIIGILLKHAKRNWFIGIRTPWTLSDDTVWKKTHEKGSIMFKFFAVMFLISMFFGEYSFWFILVPILAGTLWLFYYSYVEYNKIKKKK